MFGQGPFGKALDVAAQVVNGVCPMCTEVSVLISIHKTVFRCTTCVQMLNKKLMEKLVICHMSLETPQQDMSRKSKSIYGTIAKRDKPKKRPGRHKKNRNKHEKRMGKFRGKGRKGR